MPARPPSLGAIAAFEAAARHGSFAKAAEDLNLTRSAISHAVRTLEARLSQALFERDGRSVRLTAEGARLAARIRVSLSLLTEALEAPAPFAGRLVIGAPRAVACRVLGPRLGRFQALHPGVHIALRGDEAALRPESGEAHLVLHAGAHPSLALNSRLLFSERVLPVGPPDFAAYRDIRDVPPSARIESLDQPWAVWFADLGLDAADAPASIIVDDEVLAIELAKAGVGACLARQMLVADDLRQGRLVRIGPITSLGVSVYLVTTDRAPRGAPVQQFAAWLAEELAAGGGAQTLANVPADRPSQQRLRPAGGLWAGHA